LTGDDLLQAVFESSTLGIALLRSDGRLRAANKRLQQILGYTEAELCNMTGAELTYSGDAAVEIALFEELVSGQRNDYQLNKRCVHKSGAVIWVRLSVWRRPGLAESIFVATIEDITAARSTEAKQRELLYALGERVKELTALHRSARVLLQTRGSRHEQLQAVAELLPPAMQYPEITTGCIRCGDETYATAGHRNSPWMLESHFTTADGRAGVVEVAYHEARPEDAVGPFLREEVTLLASLAEMICAAVDRESSEHALHETNKRLNLAFTAADLGIWEWDVARDTVRWSEHLSRMFGLEGGHTGPFGANLEIVHSEDRERVFMRLRRAAEGEDDLRELEFRIRGANGEWLPLKCKALIEREAPARATRIIVVLMNMSARGGLHGFGVPERAGA
jgi:PAS domain S-box-containing protein